MSIFNIFDAEVRPIIESPVIRISYSDAHFDQHSIPQFHLSNQDLLAPIEESHDSQGILHIDNPIVIDSEKDRLEYLYSQRREDQNTEDVLEEYEVPPVRLANISQRRFPISVRSVCVLDIKGGINPRQYQPLIIIYDQENSRIIPRGEYPHEIFEIFQPRFQNERNYFDREEIRYSSIHVVIPPQNISLLRFQDRLTF